MRISKQTKKTTLAQQGRYLLICLLSMLLLFLAGSVLILNRTQRQVYEQLEEISKLYTDELDNRFFRISRNLFSTGISAAAVRKAAADGDDGQTDGAVVRI